MKNNIKLIFYIVNFFQHYILYNMPTIENQHIKSELESYKKLEKLKKQYQFLIYTSTTGLNYSVYKLYSKIKKKESIKVPLFLTLLFTNGGCKFLKEMTKIENVYSNLLKSK